MSGYPVDMEVLTHAPCQSRFTTLLGFQRHVSKCSALDRTERDRLRWSYREAAVDGQEGAILHDSAPEGPRTRGANDTPSDQGVYPPISGVTVPSKLHGVVPSDGDYFGPLRKPCKCGAWYRDLPVDGCTR